jgi:hypothetical protein
MKKLIYTICALVIGFGVSAKYNESIPEPTAPTAPTIEQPKDVTPEPTKPIEPTKPNIPTPEQATEPATPAATPAATTNSCPGGVCGVQNGNQPQYRFRLFGRRR